MKRSFFSVLVALIWALNAAVAAEKQQPTNPSPAGLELDPLTLDRAMELAEQWHPDLTETRALIEAAEGRAKQAGLLPNPEAVARVESAPFSRRTGSEAEYVAGVSQRLPLGNRLSKARGAELLDRERAVKQSDLTQREVRRRVHSAFATALYQDRAHELNGEIAENTRRMVGLVKARVDAGDAAPEDLARAEMELGRVKVELRRSQTLREQALGALAVAIGRSDLRFKSLGGTLESAFEIPTMESLAAELRKHPALALARAEVESQRARIDLAKAERIPDVRVDLLYRRLSAEKKDAFDVGVSIPLPLFDRSQGRLREARAELTAAEARARSTELDLGQQLREAHGELTVALEQAKTLREELLPRAETVRKAAEARYESGDTGLFELLPVRSDWADAQLRQLESLRDAMSAWVMLNSCLTMK